MKVTTRLEYGPLEVELAGEDRKQVQQELTEFLSFIHQEGVIDALHNPPFQDQNKYNDDSVGEEFHKQFSESTGPDFESLATKTSVDQSALSQLIELPDDPQEGVPSLNMHHFDEGTLALGNYRNQRQAQASALLLYVWDECLDRKKVSYELLDESLTESDIETERRDVMRDAFNRDASDWFESDGSNIWLIGQGKTHSRNILQELTEEMIPDA